MYVLIFILTLFIEVINFPINWILQSTNEIINRVHLFY